MRKFNWADTLQIHLIANLRRFNYLISCCGPFETKSRYIQYSLEFSFFLKDSREEKDQWRQTLLEQLQSLIIASLMINNVYDASKQNILY